MNQPAETITDRQRVRAVILKMSYQFPGTTEGRLMFGVVAQAIMDLLSSPSNIRYENKNTRFERQGADNRRRSAAHYLCGEMGHAELCGVDSEWVRSLLDRAGVEFRQYAMVGRMSA